MSKLSSFSQYENMSPQPDRSQVKVAATYGGQNINFWASSFGTPASQTFDNTSTLAMSGQALNFLSPSTSAIQITYKTTTDTQYKLNVTQSTRTVGETTTTINTLGVQSVTGTTTIDGATVALEDIQNIVDYGYIQESGTAASSGADGFITDSMKAALQSRETSYIDGTDDVENVRTGARTLVEDDVVRFAANGTALDLSAVKCKWMATAELWIDISNADTEITWPAPEGGKVTWIETSQPSSLPTGKRCVLVIRNDSIRSGITHYAMNYSYQEATDDLYA